MRLIQIYGPIQMLAFDLTVHQIVSFLWGLQSEVSGSSGTPTRLEHLTVLAIQYIYSLKTVPLFGSKPTQTFQRLLDFITSLIFLTMRLKIRSTTCTTQPQWSLQGDAPLQMTVLHGWNTILQIEHMRASLLPDFSKQDANAKLLWTPMMR